MRGVRRDGEHEQIRHSPMALKGTVAEYFSIPMNLLRERVLLPCFAFDTLGVAIHLHGEEPVTVTGVAEAEEVVGDQGAKRARYGDGERVGRRAGAFGASRMREDVLRRDERDAAFAREKLDGRANACAHEAMEEVICTWGRVAIQSASLGQYLPASV